MKNLARTSSHYSLNSPTSSNSTKRFSKLKQNLDIYNIRANNYRTELERSFERASRTEEYFMYGSSYRDSSPPSSSFSKPFSSSTKKSIARLNSSPYMNLSIKKDKPTPSSIFKQKWNYKTDFINEDSSQQLSFNYDDLDQKAINKFSNHDHAKSLNDQGSFNFLNNRQYSNALANKNEINPSNNHTEVNASFNQQDLNPSLMSSQSSLNQKNIKQINDENDSYSSINNIIIQDKKEDTFSRKKEILFTPNRINSHKKITQEKESKHDLQNNTIDQFNNQNGEEEFIENGEEECGEKEIENPSIDITDHLHSQAYLQAMNSMNSKMKQFSSELNTNRNPNKTVQSNQKNNETDSLEKSEVEINISQFENVVEEEEEFKKKQRVELEEIKNLYNLVEQELNKIKAESNATNSIHENNIVLNIEEEGEINEIDMENISNDSNDKENSALKEN